MILMKLFELIKNINLDYFLHNSSNILANMSSIINNSKIDAFTNIARNLFMNNW